MNKTDTAAPAAPVTSASPRRGMKKAEVIKLVESFKFPTSPFTLKELFNSFGFEHWYIADYVKRNGKIVGDAPKVAGSRGPAAKLWQLDTK